MFKDLSTTLIVIAGFVALYYIILAVFFRKKLSFCFGRAKEGTPSQFTTMNATDFPHQLIDRPGIEEDEIAVVLGREKDPKEWEVEMVEDEESVLLKAAEIVVEKVQDVVGHIASNPPNPEEVYSKIRAIVNQYQIFHNTEYFDAINSFIAITVDRDCGIKLTKEELLSLWN